MKTLFLPSACARTASRIRQFIAVTKIHGLNVLTSKFSCDEN